MRDPWKFVPGMPMLAAAVIVDERRRTAEVNLLGAALVAPGRYRRHMQLRQGGTSLGFADLVLLEVLRNGGRRLQGMLFGRFIAVQMDLVGGDPRTGNDREGKCRNQHAE